MNRLVRMTLFSVAVIITFVGGANACAAEKAAKLIPARIAVVSRSTLDLPFWVAREQGFFREEGIDAEIILFRASLAVPAMIGGSVDFGTATGTALSAAVNGADVRIVMAMSERPSFDLFVQPGITSIQQLRGKKIGYGGVGGLTEIIIRQILSANQISLDQVTFLTLGGDDVSFTSLRAGVVDAVMLQIPATFLAQDEGFRKIAAGADYYRAVQGGLTATKNFPLKNRRSSPKSSAPPCALCACSRTIRNTRLRLSRRKTTLISARSASVSPSAPTKRRRRDIRSPAWSMKNCSVR